MIAEFDPIQALAGGMLIGLASVLLKYALGRITGISGIALGVITSPASDKIWRIAFLGGLVAAPFVYSLIMGFPVPLVISDNIPALLIGGILVGLGAVVGGGCTSGHGICGIGRLSLRSVVSVTVFMATAMIVFNLSRHVFGWPS